MWIALVASSQVLRGGPAEFLTKTLRASLLLQTGGGGVPRSSQPYH
jgi:hypothetical protein